MSAIHALAVEVLEEELMMMRRAERDAVRMGLATGNAVDVRTLQGQQERLRQSVRFLAAGPELIERLDIETRPGQVGVMVPATTLETLRRVAGSPNARLDITS